MNNVFTKSVPLEQLQGLAVEVLAMPELCAFTRDLAGHAPDGVLPLLWTLRPGGETSAAAWRQAVMLLDRIARAGHAPPPEALYGVLDLVGGSWRALPPGLLSMMANQWSGTAPRLLRLEIQHVAAWAIAAGSLGVPPDVSAGWRSAVEQALAWRMHDEICLRSAPFEWEHSVGSAWSDAFCLLPVRTTAQLVDDCGAHRDALCRVDVAAASRDGLQAWWLARPRFVPPGGQGDPTCAIGLQRARAGEDWNDIHVHAAPEWQADAHSLAKSLRARANGDRRLQAVREMTRGLSPSVSELGNSVGSMLAARQDAVPRNRP